MTTTNPQGTLLRSSLSKIHKPEYSELLCNRTGTEKISLGVCQKSNSGFDLEQVHLHVRNYFCF